MLPNHPPWPLSEKIALIMRIKKCRILPWKAMPEADVQVVPLPDYPDSTADSRGWETSWKGKGKSTMCKINYWTVVISRQGRPENKLDDLWGVVFLAHEVIRVSIWFHSTVSQSTSQHKELLVPSWHLEASIYIGVNYKSQVHIYYLSDALSL